MKQYPLRYKDVQLQERDCQSLYPHKWLTAEAIYFGLSFYCELEKNCSKILDPSLGTFILFNDDWDDLLELTNVLSKYKHILVPINDAQGDYGQHWATLMISDNKGIVFDSAQSKQIILNAENISRKIYAIRQQKQEILKKQFSITNYKNTPKQVNNYDCGVYSIAIIKQIFEQLHKNEDNFDFSMITPQYIEELRQQLLQSINQLK